MRSYVVLGVALVGLILLYALLVPYVKDGETQEKITDYQNATYIIEGTPIKLTDGVSQIQATPDSTSSPQAGSSSVVVTRYFGNLAKGDLNGDGIPDLAFLLTQEAGGSGMFYYAVVALQSADNTYQGTNGIFLGDRIAPQSTSIMDGKLVVSYGDRKVDEPMTAPQSVGVSKTLAIENGVLVETRGETEWLISDSGAFAESGAPLTTIGLRIHGEQRGLGTYEGSCFIVEESEWELLEGEKSGIICWFAGGGQEIGIFEEDGKEVVKVGDVDEGSAEEPGIRGNFKTLLAL